MLLVVKNPKYKSCALMIILQTNMTDDRKIEGAEDLISNLPNVILQHILCSVPTTKVAISTSLLSRRWRHVWCEVPSLSLDVGTLRTAASVNEALRAAALMNPRLEFII
ncbi:unnamed protein product [Brassica rapa]|uniref:F-box domain-containing protein n=1 Tax=Brassica campestris TaxID=3711 RepID=A0A8D9DGZ4_BRACM|nr:unnamed protein product [Brassica rapa]